MSRKSTIRYLLNASSNKKKIVFLDDLGQVLDVLYVDVGETPTPPSVWPSNVEFVSWNPTVVAVTEDAVYRALVINHVTNVSFELDEYQAINTSTTILSTVEPSNAADPSVTWSTSDSSIATISNEGILTYLSTGLITITCTAQDNYMGPISHSATINVIKPVESVTIQGASIIEGPTLLQVIITPPDATIQTVTWRSSDPSAMTVSSSGLVTPITSGPVQIVVTSDDPISGASASFEIYCRYIDLGLPSGLLWATMNVGASKPEEYGNYYAWGETKAYGEEDASNAMNYSYNSSSSYVKTYYDWSTYKYCDGTENVMTKYNATDGLTELEPADDAAAVNWGGDWRMPTSAECQELVDNCPSEWVTNYKGTGVAGCLFTSNNNGNTLFLPAAGRFRLYANVQDAGTTARIWASSLTQEGAEAKYLNRWWAGTLAVISSDGSRYLGRTIRAVKNP